MSKDEANTRVLHCTVDSDHALFVFLVRLYHQKAAGRQLMCLLVQKVLEQLRALHSAVAAMAGHSATLLSAENGQSLFLVLVEHPSVGVVVDSCLVGFLGSLHAVGSLEFARFALLCRGAPLHAVVSLEFPRFALLCRAHFCTHKWIERLHATQRSLHKSAAQATAPSIECCGLLLLLSLYT